MENRHLSRSVDNAKNNIESVIDDLVAEIENYETMLDAMQDNLDAVNEELYQLKQRDSK